GATASASTGNVTAIGATSSAFAAVGNAVRALAAQPAVAPAPSAKAKAADSGLAFKAAGANADAEPDAKVIEAERALAARVECYHGGACGGGGNSALVRTGTGPKCEPCGSTTGCS